MNRIMALSISLLLTMTILPTQVLAEWQEMNPGVVGGDLTPRFTTGMTQITEDKVLMFGGRIESTTYNETWLYDVSDNRWTKQNPVITGDLSMRAHFGMAAIGGDQVLIFGGWSAGSTYLDETWLYDLSDNRWNKLNPTISGDNWGKKSYTGMAYLGGDQVLLFGGYDTTTFYLDGTWIFDLSENTWTNASPAVEGGSLTGRYDLSLSSIGEGKVIGYGGMSPSGLVRETWLYDQPSNTWTKLSPEVVGGALKASSTGKLCYIGGDRILMFGQHIGSRIGDNDLWMFDLSDNRWTKIETNGPRPDARFYTGMATIGSGKVVMFGGANVSYTLDNLYNDTWIFDLPASPSSSISTSIENGGITVSWNQSSDITDSTFYLYKNNKRISDPITSGTANGDQTLFSYFDADIPSGTLNRYKILEINPSTNSETFSKEVAVPFCN